jgi:hypothetical protein
VCRARLDWINFALSRFWFGFSNHHHKQHTKKRIVATQDANTDHIQTSQNMRTDSLSNYTQQVDKNIRTLHSLYLIRSINRISHFTSGIAYLNNLVNISGTTSSSNTTRVSQYSANSVTHSSKPTSNYAQFPPAGTYRLLRMYGGEGPRKDITCRQADRQPNTFHPNKQPNFGDDSPSGWSNSMLKYSPYQHVTFNVLKTRWRSGQEVHSSNLYHISHNSDRGVQ